MSDYQLTNNPDMIIRTSDGANIPSTHYWWVDYQNWLDAGNTPDPIPTATLTEQMQKLTQDFNMAINALTAGWPKLETSTWTTQADEAKAWTAAADDAKPDTPFLTQLWTDRQALGWTEPFADLVARVVANSAAYTQGIASIIAIRHVAERNLSLADDPSTITWDFSAATTASSG